MQRRTTLGQLHESHFNTPSAIPQPKGRFSVAPGRMSNYNSAVKAQGNMASLANDLNSLAITPNNKNARMSMNPRASLSRRSIGGRTSLIGGAVGQQVLTRDPRPIRDSAWRTACVRLLIKFLMDSGFSRDMTPKLLSAPTLKDFQLMFQFLYGKVDPNYKWTPGKKFEEEFLVLLKALKYPFAEQITKTQLQSVGSPHTWPVLLAVLIWMIELIMVSQQIEYEGDMDDGNVDGNEIFHVYLVKTYNEYLQGVENVGFSEELNELFHQKDELALNDIKRLDEENAELNTEWTKLKQETPPLVKIKQEKQNYESDIVKLNQWKEALLKKKSQIEEQLKSLNNDYDHLNNQLEKCASEKMELQQIVDNQELSPADIDRMNNERDQLSQQFDVLSEKLKETSKYVWQLEIDANKKMSLIEKQGKIFNDKCYHVELLPKNAKFAKGKNYEFKLMMSQVEKIKTSIDLKQFARDTLLNLNSALKTNTMKEEETTSELKDETDKTVEKIMDKNDSVRDLEARVANVEEQYETEKQTIQKDLEARHKEAENIEKEIRRSKMDQTRTLFDCQRILRELEIENDNLMRRTGEQKERTFAKYFAICEKIIAFRSQLSQSLHKIKESVEEEVQNLAQTDSPFISTAQLDVSIDARLMDESFGSVLYQMRE